jgi:murein DD-endopeptidase MepM/ murein hydrolase activator NlpD
MMGSQRIRRLLAAALFLGVLASAASGSAETGVQRTLRERHEAVEQAKEFRKTVADRENVLQARVAHASHVLDRGPGLGRSVHPERWAMLRRQAERTIRSSRASLKDLHRWEKRHLASLHARHDQLDSWLSSWGVFRVCPVPGYTTIANDYGEIVRLPKVPVHVHRGSDISAPTGSPIRAPFDGYASASSSGLGGLEVRVKGARGYAYNAHLSSVGKLGYVHAGDVIGTVGSTGDATGPHDHFEWHPWNGGAVDPYSYLVAACVDA